MRRYLMTSAVLTVLIFVVSGPVGAGLQWCPRDPIIGLNGQEVQIWVSIPEVYQTAVTGPVDVDVATPHGVEQEVLFTDEGFNGHGEEVTFRENGQLVGDQIPVRLKVSVPYDRSMVDGADLPVLLTVVLPDGTTLELQDDRGKARMDFVIQDAP